MLLYAIKSIPAKNIIALVQAKLTFFFDLLLFNLAFSIITPPNFTVSEYGLTFF